MDEIIPLSEKPQIRTFIIKNSQKEFAKFGVKNIPKEFLVHLREQRRHTKATHDNSINETPYPKDNHMNIIDEYSVSDDKLGIGHKPQETHSDYQIHFKDASNIAPPFSTGNYDTNEVFYSEDFSGKFSRGNINVEKTGVGSSFPSVVEGNALKQENKYSLILQELYTEYKDPIVKDNFRIEQLEKRQNYSNFQILHFQEKESNNKNAVTNRKTDTLINEDEDRRKHPGNSH